MRNFRKELLEQYKSSQGIKSTSSKQQIYMIDFVPRLLEMEEIGSNYIEYLKYLGLPFDAYTCAEVGKSFLDSVDKNYKTTIITPNIEGFSNIDNTRIINGQFQIIDSKPVILLPGSNDEYDGKIQTLSSIRTYMTQNPYRQQDIANFDKLHNSKEAAIILGAYGSIHDHDIEDKIIQLRTVLDKTNGNMNESYEENNGEYYYVISSNIKTKKLIKTLSR